MNSEINFENNVKTYSTPQLIFKKLFKLIFLSLLLMPALIFNVGCSSEDNVNSVKELIKFGFNETESNKLVSFMEDGIISKIDSVKDYTENKKHYVEAKTKEGLIYIEKKDSKITITDIYNLPIIIEDNVNEYYFTIDDDNFSSIQNYTRLSIDKFLKSPSSSRYSNWSYERLLPQENFYAVKGTVRALNSFGMETYSKFTFAIEYNPKTDGLRAITVKIDGSIMYQKLKKLTVFVNNGQEPIDYYYTDIRRKGIYDFDYSRPGYEIDYITIGDEKINLKEFVEKYESNNINNNSTAHIVWKAIN